MNKAKYFKIKKLTDRSNTTVYKLYSCNTFMEFIFSMWDEYNKDNDTLEDAINQMFIINKLRIDSEKVVYRKVIK